MVSTSHVEPMEVEAVLGKRGRKQLHCHPAPQAHVLRPVHGTHPAPPEQLLQAEAGQLTPRTRIGPDGHGTPFLPGQ